MLSLVVGPRTQDSADELVGRMANVLVGRLPLFASDGLDQYGVALFDRWHVEVPYPPTGKRGRPRNPAKHPDPDLYYVAPRGLRRPGEREARGHLHEPDRAAEPDAAGGQLGARAQDVGVRQGRGSTAGPPGVVRRVLPLRAPSPQPAGEIAAARAGPREDVSDLAAAHASHERDPNGSPVVFARVAHPFARATIISLEGHDRFSRRSSSVRLMMLRSKAVAALCAWNHNAWCLRA